jgi:hypothetical protein
MKLRLHPRNLVTAFLGLLVIGAALYTYVQTAQEFAAVRETKATVIDIVYETGTLQKGRMHPVVRFTTEDGRQVVGRSDKHRKVALGQSVQVLYDPAQPERVELQTLTQARRQRFLFGGLMIALGLAMILTSIALDLGLVRVRDGAASTRVYPKR